MPTPALPRPKWPIARISDIANGTLALTAEFRADLEPRLAAGLIDHLAANLAAFDGKRAQASNAPVALEAATRTQDAASAAGFALVSGVRRSLARLPSATKADKKAFGVGERLSSRSVPQVLAGLDALLAASAERTAVVRAAGLLPADLEDARSLRAQLSGADDAQSTLKATKTSATAARNALAAAIALDVDAILAAASIAFHARPDVAARFEAVVPGTGRKTRKAPAPAA